MEMLTTVVIGTTGICNARCLICVKAQRSHGYMSDELYRKLIDGIATVRAERIGFGLFNEPLTDPKIADRVKYCCEKVPDVPIILNTNGLLLTPKTARRLIPYINVFVVAFHALDKELYAKLMPPLNQETVIKNIIWIAEHKLCHNEVRVSVVGTKLNFNQYQKIQNYFKRYGITVQLDMFLNRAGLIDDVYDELAVYPVGEGCCDENVTKDLIVDWDGKVLLCCQDFKREFVIGDLSSSFYFEEVLNNSARLAVREKLAKRQHKEILTCFRCRWSRILPHGGVADENEK